jgi:hypothetical protein
MNDYESKFFDDDGHEINPDLIPTQDLCLTCIKNSLGREEDILCLLTRSDQQDHDEFVSDT